MKRSKRGLIAPNGSDKCCSLANSSDIPLG